jgi:tRNA-dihydrouridine synthase
VYQLKKDFPELVIVANGGVAHAQQVQQHLARVDGVMIGRAAYDTPWFLTEWDDIIQHMADSLIESSASPSSSYLQPSPIESSSSSTLSASAIASPPHAATPEKDFIEDAMVVYMQQQMASQPPPFHWRSIARHMLGLRNGQVLLCCASFRCTNL